MPITLSKVIILLVSGVSLLYAFLHWRMVFVYTKNTATLPDKKYHDWLVKIEKTRRFFAQTNLTVATMLFISTFFYMYRNWGLNDAEIGAKYAHFFGSVAYGYMSDAFVISCCLIFWQYFLMPMKLSSNKMTGFSGISSYLVKIYADQNFAKEADWVDIVEDGYKYHYKFLVKYKKHVLLPVKMVYYPCLLAWFLYNTVLCIACIYFMLALN